MKKNPSQLEKGILVIKLPHQCEISMNNLNYSPLSYLKHFHFQEQYSYRIQINLSKRRTIREGGARQFTPPPQKKNKIVKGSHSHGEKIKQVLSIIHILCSTLKTILAWAKRSYTTQRWEQMPCPKKLPNPPPPEKKNGICKKNYECFIICEIRK